MAGGRVMSELMYLDFIGRAGDEVFNQMSKWQAMSGDVLKMPLCSAAPLAPSTARSTLRIGRRCARISGPQGCVPGNAFTTKGLLNAALNGTDPVIFAFESQRTYDLGEMFQKEVPAGYYK